MTVDTQLHQSLKELKMWSISKNTGKNLWRHILNVLRTLRILWRPNMESFHHKSISKVYHNMMHQN